VAAKKKKIADTIKESLKEGRQQATGAGEHSRQQGSRAGPAARVAVSQLTTTVQLPC
jgi:hypothetical protein